MFACVEILVFGVYKNPLRLREVHTIDRNILIMFLDRRNSKNSDEMFESAKSEVISESEFC